MNLLKSVAVWLRFLLIFGETLAGFLCAGALSQAGSVLYKGVSAFFQAVVNVGGFH